MENNFTNKIVSSSLKENSNLDKLDKTVKDLYQILSHYSGDINNLEEFNDNKKILLEYVEIIERLEKVNKENSEALEKLSNELKIYNKEKFFSIFTIGLTFSKSSKNQESRVKNFKNKLKNKIKESFSQELIMKIKRRKNIIKIYSLILKLFSLRLKIKTLTFS